MCVRASVHARARMCVGPIVHRCVLFASLFCLSILRLPKLAIDLLFIWMHADYRALSSRQLIFVLCMHGWLLSSNVQPL